MEEVEADGGHESGGDAGHAPPECGGGHDEDHEDERDVRVPEGVADADQQVPATRMMTMAEAQAQPRPSLPPSFFRRSSLD